MTPPNEKAKQLFYKFQVKEFNEISGWVTNNEESKKMVLNIVDEIVSAINIIPDPRMEHKIFYKLYWQDVKTEINNHDPQN